MKTPKAWLKKFYPKPANKVSKKDAVNHSLKKWQGLLEIKSYGILRMNTDSKGHFGKDFYLVVDDSSCALCAHFIDEDTECPKCPLSIVRGGAKCATKRDDEEMSPYDLYTKKNNPKPMIKWLEVAKAYVDRFGV